ncbi:unnamed protein product [Mycena citricolor]|uniref:F-box domain-containing protein n=1 Tax=Mycena citricolor TaxID=2018698 RepID=A0AAD2GSP2_9AGAR|nr:unnamed protein product [Mycena citricolor]CAK5263315.1 unnamed protein product [Mycena citricolor]CAK5277962.1 unnamed protein product [Mycena citricolor]
MSPLPLELLQQISKDAQWDETIFTLRLVSRALRDAATPIAFREIVVTDSVKSGAALLFLETCTLSVAPLVESVRFDAPASDRWTSGACPVFWNQDAATDLISGPPEEVESQARRVALSGAFSGLSNFPRLKSLHLEFHDTFQEDGSHDIPEQPTHYLLLQQEIFAALASRPLSTLRSLTLHNLIAVPHDIYTRDGFRALFKSARTVDISVISDVDYEGAYFQDPLVDYWNISVPSMLEYADEVRTLVIRSDQGVGSQPALNVATLRFPRLTALSLYDFVFVDTALEYNMLSFIVQHGKTLESLELADCSIDGDEMIDFPYPWHAVLSRFEAELETLKRFVFQSESGEEQFCYTRLDVGFGYMSLDAEHEAEAIPPPDLDSAALESLLAVVQSRQ